MPCVAGTLRSRPLRACQPSHHAGENGRFMSSIASSLDRLKDRCRSMGGRNPHEPNRTSTPLELLFDLTFVIAFSQASSEIAHVTAEGHSKTAIFGMSLAMFASIWAWISFTWFASAFDTGLHVCASYLDHEAHIGTVSTILTVIVPVLVFSSTVGYLYVLLLGVARIRRRSRRCLARDGRRGGHGGRACADSDHQTSS